ncbi:MAG: chorismate mutase [Planctomycetota bacterium]
MSREDATVRLAAYRRELDELDAALVQILARRFRVIARIGHLKARAGLPIRDPDREKEMLLSLARQGVEEGIAPALVRRVFTAILLHSRRRQRAIRRRHARALQRV